MEREDNVIDLGTASIETKGPGGNAGDVGLNQILTGLTED
ncbi:benenodin family lasso peptide [Sphingobium scionense]|jgi:hypothetical protein|uniref:Benenodin family lasso peptide n=2 Tax=Sphingobium TaxID=165695 RepID=A0A5J5I5Q4_9SPHN|nr:MULTISPECIES: benenodin family lasso peptide [Sphingobium]KAA9011892.1 benenodin family lasso peptide [Sphingobium limneticum]KAA9029215.1 benenodin family lasso peptide [Sphingobium limneticum]MBB4151593.1 hypothetical protein [Sphingobium scionense]|tara:strand:- start:700 stop:819 length:120 start_codon:yes stop_codon:yes gene_type:complete